MPGDPSTNPSSDGYTQTTPCSARVGYDRTHDLELLHKLCSTSFEDACGIDEHAPWPSNFQLTTVGHGQRTSE